MKKGVAAGIAIGIGACFWWVGNIPAERIVRVKPSKLWLDEHGHREDEFIMPVSLDTKLHTRIIGDDEFGNFFYDGKEYESAGYVEELTIYKKCFNRYVIISSYADLSVEEANQKILHSHTSRMNETTFLHQMWYEK